MTTEQHTAEAQRLRDGLRSERQIYESLAEIANRQGEILQKGQTDALLELARVKEQELDRIESAERELAPLKQTWPVIRERISGALRLEVETEIDQIETVLRRLIDLENAGQRGMDSLRQETAESIRKVEGGRRMHQAYRSHSPAAPPRYLDKSE